MSVILVEDGVNAGLVWHRGNPVVETRVIEAGGAVVDLSGRGVLEITRAGRLGWLHSLVSQHLESLGAGKSFEVLVLSPNGRVEHVLTGVDDETWILAWTEPGHATTLVGFLTSMRFMMQVEVRPRDDLWLTWVDDDVEVPGDWARRPVLGGREVFRPADAALPEGRPIGIWALDAYHTASGVPRIFIDTDARTIPNEIGLFGTHLDRDCYRGQETVAHAHNLDRPPRRLTLLHLGGTAEALPAAGPTLGVGGRAVGFADSSTWHHGLESVTLALMKRAVPTDVTLIVDRIATAQETLVDPKAGLYFRANLH